MSELREECLKIIESLEETIEHNFDYHCLNEEKSIHLLEAFAREQRRAAFEDAFIEIQRLNDQDQLAVHKFHNMFMWIKLNLLHADDPEIQRMREEWK